MERNENGFFQFTPREESIIAKALAAEDSESRAFEQGLVDRIGAALFDAAHHTIESPSARQNAFTLAREASSWLWCLMAVRWPLKHIEGAERYLSELSEDGASEQKTNVEAMVERLDKSS